MKKALALFAYVLACLGFIAGFAVLLGACKTSPEAIAARQATLEQLAGMTADGVITQDEVDGLQGAWDAYEAAPKSGTPGWVEPLATLGGSLLAGFVGLRYLPNRHILGTQPDPEVARVAGTS